VRPSDDRQNTVSALTTANVLLGLLAAVFLGAFIYAEFLYQPELNPQAAARYTEVAKARLAEHSDEILAEVGDVTAETAPVIGKALYDQSQEDYKLYLTALEREGKTYLANVEEILVAEAQDQYGEFLRRHRQVLREEFPDQASDENVEQVLAEFDQTFDRLIERYYLDEFRRESQRTVALWKTSSLSSFRSPVIRRWRNNSPTIRPIGLSWLPRRFRPPQRIPPPRILLLKTGKSLKPLAASPRQPAVDASRPLTLNTGTL
jgi:hypothetical protein